MRRILAYLGKYKGEISVTLSVKALATLIELALPYIMGLIIDCVVGTPDPETVSELKISIVNGIEALLVKTMARFSDSIPGTTVKTVEIVVWALIMIICAGLGVLGNVWANRRTSLVARNVSEDCRNDLFVRTMWLSPAQTDAFTVPSLESRLTTDTYNIHSFINTTQRMGIRAPVLLFGGLAITALQDWRLTLIMVAVLPLIFIAVFFLTAKGLPLYTRVQKAVDGMIRVVREDAEGIRVIKALSKKKYEFRRYDEENVRLAAIERKTNILMSSANPAMTFFMNLGLVAVVMLGAVFVNRGVSTSGNIISFIQYFTMISGAMMAVTRLFVMWSKASASARRITEVLETKAGLPVASEEEFPARKEESGIVFDDVSFSYTGKANVLENISFSVKKGQKLGVIGATGSGKTTLTALMMRFYDVSRGSVRIDGRDVRTIPEEELHSMFGVAMQNDFIAADTIEENIIFGRNLTHEDAVRAAKIAQANEFIETLDEKYQYSLTSKGTNVSGGQRQRILISRAIAGSPQILILDDSSSALDYRTDSLLRRAIAEEMKGVTTVTVAQRVSSVMSSDVIIVLDEGKIIGLGTHEQLMESCPVYREISDSQMGGAFLE